MEAIQTLTTRILLLPEWGKTLAIRLLGIYVVLQLVHLTMKKLQAPELRGALRALKDLSGAALRKAGESLRLPVERPRLALVASVVDTALMYVYLLFFLVYFGISLMLSAVQEGAPLRKMLVGFTLSAFFAVITRYYFVVAEKQRIGLVARWQARGTRR